MIRILTNKEIWKDEKLPRDVFREICPNPKCSPRVLKYPSFIIVPYCPDCRSYLPAAKTGIRDGHGKRIAYHLEI